MGHVDFLRHVPGLIHVGANTGQERDTYDDHGLKVIWIEAVPEIFDQLVRNISGYPAQSAICALLSDQNLQNCDFHIANNEGASSSLFQFGQHHDIWPDVHYVATQNLLSTRLDTLLQRHSILINEYPAMVLDVQGAELLVLKGAGRFLHEFRFIKAEAADFESYVNGARLDDLQRYLRAFGFEECARRQFAAHPSRGSYWDVVWEHKPARLTGANGGYTAGLRGLAARLRWRRRSSSRQSTAR